MCLADAFSKSFCYSNKRTYNWNVEYVGHVRIDKRELLEGVHDMNPLYNQLFNPQYANQDYLQHLHWQQHDTEQRQEIMNAVKAIHDYFDSARKIAPEYQQMAFDACITAVVTEMNNGNR